METILAADRSLFHLLNGVWTCGFLDLAMPLVTDAKLWAPFLIVAWLWLIFGAQGRHRALALLLALGIGGSDYLTSGIIKKAVGRKRPCCMESDARLLVPCKSSKSFPSSHAANTAAAAAVIWLEAGTPAGATFAFVSFVVGYSRISIGVHYPADVAVGWLAGVLVAFVVVLVRRRFFGRPAPPVEHIPMEAPATEHEESQIPPSSDAP
ncbi:phosphatase PAP2 family protein [Candidatus Ozemobacteraceae bacterium]|nr:phosphatase PAP2 family protein [Candidatus Ozemobacteraceae bacterium]